MPLDSLRYNDTQNTINEVFDFLIAFASFGLGINLIISPIDVLPEYTTPRNIVAIDERTKHFIRKKEIGNLVVNYGRNDPTVRSK
jgi:hypothetical protein